MNFILTFGLHRDRVLDGYQKGSSDNGASKAQAKSQQQAIDLQREQWNQTTQNMAPYLQVGAPAINSLNQMSSQQGQADFLNNYYNSDNYNQLASQARNQQLAAGEATGSLGSASMQNSLATIAPQLGLNAYNSQLQQYANLANIGQSAAANQAASGQSYANNLSGLYQGMGSINAGAAQQGSTGKNALMGAASGAASGAMIGSVVPGIGTAFGAIGGGIIGGLGSLL